MGTSVSTQLVHHGERRDQSGRQHVPPERRRELLAAYRESGLTRVAFARPEGVRYPTFCTWMQQAGKLGGRSKPPAPMRFAEVALPAGVARDLEVPLRDGTTLRGKRVEELAALVRALRG